MAVISVLEVVDVSYVALQVRERERERVGDDLNLFCCFLLVTLLFNGFPIQTLSVMERWGKCPMLATFPSPMPESLEADCTLN